MEILVQAATLTIPVARDISQMANASQDQSMLIYVLIAAYAPLVTVIGVLWRKWETARKYGYEAQKTREALIQDHNREMMEMVKERNKTSEQLALIMDKLKS